MLEYNTDLLEMTLAENTATKHVAICTKSFFAKPALDQIEIHYIVNSATD